MISSWNNVVGTSSVRRMDKALPPVSSLFFPQNLVVLLPFLFPFFFCYNFLLLITSSMNFQQPLLKGKKDLRVFNLSYAHKIRLLMYQYNPNSVMRQPLFLVCSQHLLCAPCYARPEELRITLQRACF